MQADWADGPGRSDIERLYMCSSVLNGDAVVIFMRALCAVSQEELMPASPEEPARYQLMDMSALRWICTDL